MKLLLVDDEEYVIESIKRNLDLTETGVSEVYTAFSVQQAKNIMGMVDKCYFFHLTVSCEL